MLDPSCVGAVSTHCGPDPLLEKLPVVFLNIANVKELHQKGVKCQRFDFHSGTEEKRKAKGKPVMNERKRGKRLTLAELRRTKKIGEPGPKVYALQKQSW